MKLKLRPLDTQVVVITGATSGIGLVTARKAAAKRARLVLASRNEGALRFLADEINAAGGEAVHAVADVANEEDVRRIAATARQRFGGFDTWVNNAGVSIYGMHPLIVGGLLLAGAGLAYVAFRESERSGHHNPNPALAQRTI